MTAAVLRALFLELRRDRGALVMAFVLPVIFFLVFAWIFAGAGGGDLRIRLAVADTVGDADTRALIEQPCPSAYAIDEVVASTAANATFFMNMIFSP